MPDPPSLPGGRVISLVERGCVESDGISRSNETKLYGI